MASHVVDYIGWFANLVLVVCDSVALFLLKWPSHFVLKTLVNLVEL